MPHLRTAKNGLGRSQRAALHGAHSGKDLATKLRRMSGAEQAEAEPKMR